MPSEMTLLPLNRIRARLYPAKVLTTTEMEVVTTATSALFLNHVKKLVS